MLMFEEYQNIIICFLRTNQSDPLPKNKKKTKLSFGMHSQLINMICKKIWSLKVYNMYTYMPQTRPHKCIWQIFTSSSVEKQNYTSELYKCKCKTFECVNVNHKCKWLTITQDSHAIHMTIDTYTRVLLVF